MKYRNNQRPAAYYSAVLIENIRNFQELVACMHVQFVCENVEWDMVRWGRNSGQLAHYSSRKPGVICSNFLHWTRIESYTIKLMHIFPFIMIFRYFDFGYLNVFNSLLFFSFFFFNLFIVNHSCMLLLLDPLSRCIVRHLWALKNK